ncbi:MAG: hypothetical protein G01um101472_266 [Parcubacteria group bacterium Gr01-1014_72]|nr:MAG: hypothetical protein G01um101472_266 [Parcubacteria group bacterium Gr01-1014_72]
MNESLIIVPGEAGESIAKKIAAVRRVRDELDSSPEKLRRALETALREHRFADAFALKERLQVERVRV